MEVDNRQYGRDGRIFLELLTADRATQVDRLMFIPQNWMNDNPVSDVFERITDEDYDFDDSGLSYWCDTPYGWRRGNIIYDEENGGIFTTNDGISPTIRGYVNHFGTGNLYWAVDADTWEPVPPHTEMPAEVRRGVAGNMATIGTNTADEDKRIFDAIRKKVPATNLPPSEHPVQIPNKEVSLDPLPNSDIKSGLPQIEEAVKSTMVEAMKTLIKTSGKTILQQAMDEGYSPGSYESPTHVVRPDTASPTQLLAYLVVCASINVDLGVNELQSLRDDPDAFFANPWPAWAVPDKVDRIVVKSAAIPAIA